MKNKFLGIASILITTAILTATGYAFAEYTKTTVSVPLSLEISTTTDEVFIATNGRVYITTGSKVFRNNVACE